MVDLLSLLGRFHQASNLILGTASGALGLENNVGTTAGAPVQASAAGKKEVNDIGPAPSQLAAKTRTNDSLVTGPGGGQLPLEQNTKDNPGKTLEDFEMENFTRLESREKAKKSNPAPKAKGLKVLKRPASQTSQKKRCEGQGSEATCQHKCQKCKGSWQHCAGLLQVQREELCSMQKPKFPGQALLQRAVACQSQGRKA